MSDIFSLIVTDTSPLITLALANSLDVLLHPKLPIRIPDAVYIEATRVRAAAGAGEIVDWINRHLDEVRIVPTEVGIDQQRRIEEGRTTRSLGEQAAIEALERYLTANPDGKALLLFEDSDLRKRQAIVDERVSLITTGDFLRALERVGLIQSTDHILDLAAERGRNVERLRHPPPESAARESLENQLDRKKAVDLVKQSILDLSEFTGPPSEKKALQKDLVALRDRLSREDREALTRDEQGVLNAAIEAIRGMER